MKLPTILLLFGTIPAFSQSLEMNIPSIGKPVVNLNGTWKINTRPENNSRTDKMFTSWDDIRVPGELEMQGFDIEYDKPFIYKKLVMIPPDFRGQMIVLRFDGVYSYSRLWINDNFVGEHHGGFTRWENDITEWAPPGKPIVVTLEVTDMKDEISFGSGYAKHQIGGILRDVTLYALPQNHINDFVIESDLDDEYNDATLKFSFRSFQKQNAVVLFTLTDPQGNIIQLSNNKVDLSQGENQKSVSNLVSKPLKWDAEHPNLYSLKAELTVGNKKIYSFTEKVGFREVEIRKNMLLINGQPVKFRGACRHDIHPTLGRIATDQYDKADALLAKEANINFFRTSHYPPSERFLKYCDEYGIYVEAESAVCFVGTHSDPAIFPRTESASQNNPGYENRYLNQLQEMLNTSRNHPSVIMWSLGNESIYGSNFQKSFTLLKNEDTTRPIIFSYPGSVPAEEKCYDILSMHYPGFDGNVFNQYGFTIRGFNFDLIPVIFDEWAHVPCYTRETLRQDPNIREFWGESLDRMWSGIFENQGGLGGAIWGFVDETFMLPSGSTDPARHLRTDSPDTCVGYGEWGIIDTWRRHKPEFWGTKKAYSPVKVLQTETGTFASGTELFLPIQNRYDHTNLNEIEISFIYQGRKMKIEGPDIKPHEKGFIIIPANNWKSGESFRLEFLKRKPDELIDAEEITLSGGITAGDLKDSGTGTLDVEENNSQLIIKGADFIIPINKISGMIENAVFKGSVIIKSGPYINASVLLGNKMIIVAKSSDWKPGNVSYRKQNNKVIVEINGSYATAKSRIILQVDSDANFYADYMFMGNSVGLSRESGLTFVLNSTLFEALQWDRKAYWSTYPENHPGIPGGTTSLYNKMTPLLYRKNPDRDWSMDDKNFYYFGIRGSNVQQPLVNQAKAMKENIKEYSVLSDTKNVKLVVTKGDYPIACRLSKPSDDNLLLHINTYWDYPEIAWGNYSKNRNSEPVTGSIRFQIK